MAIDTVSFRHWLSRFKNGSAFAWTSDHFDALSPKRISSGPNKLTYKSPALMEDVEVVGPAALYIQAAIDTEDTNWMVTLSDINREGKRTPLTTGWLKASHREIVEAKSKPWAPYHPHTRAVPVPPGEFCDFADPGLFYRNHWYDAADFAFYVSCHNPVRL